MQRFYFTQKQTWQNKDLFLRPDDHKINSRIWAKWYTFNSNKKACTCAPKNKKNWVPVANLIVGILRGGNWSEQTATMCERVLLWPYPPVEGETGETGAWWITIWSKLVFFFILLWAHSLGYVWMKVGCKSKCHVISRILRKHFWIAAGRPFSGRERGPTLSPALMLFKSPLITVVQQPCKWQPVSVLKPFPNT